MRYKPANVWFCSSQKNSRPLFRNILSLHVVSPSGNATVWGNALNPCTLPRCVRKVPICYGRVADLLATRQTNKSATSWQLFVVMNFGKRHNTADFCLCQLVAELLRCQGKPGETGVMDFVLKLRPTRLQVDEVDRVDRLTLESSWVVTTGPSRVDRSSRQKLSWVDRLARLDRFRGLVTSHKGSPSTWHKWTHPI